jgi:endonuclease YncB( thermonuclease family)
MHPWFRVLSACCLAVLILAFQLSLEAHAGNPLCPPTYKPQITDPDISCEPLCLCPPPRPEQPTSLRSVRSGTHHTTVRRTPHRTGKRVGKAARQKIAAYRLWRQMILTRYPWLRDGQQARLLDEWRIRLIDGDTFAYGAERIRIRGIDTPEVSESGGFEASQRLDLLLREGPVMVIPQALDVYGRVVADVYVNDQNVAEVLKEEGYAKTGAR